MTDQQFCFTIGATAFAVTFALAPFWIFAFAL